MDLYNETIQSIYNKHCPSVIKRYRVDCHRPCWYDQNLQNLKQHKRKCERKFRKSPTDENKTKFKKSRNHYNKELSLSRKKFYNKKIMDYKDEPKKMFKTLSKLSGSAKKNILPTFAEKHIVAEKLSNFYIEKVMKIRSKIESEIQVQTFSGNITSAITTFDNFTEITLEDLQSVTKLLNNKTCHLDPAPTMLISKFSEILHPVILHIVNSGIRQTLFPNNLKHASIVPVMKNPSYSPDDLQNLRPISRLPYLSKVKEKVLYLQLENYIESNNLHATSQSGYRKYCSTETAIIRTYDDIQQSLNNKKYVVLLLLDSSAAFDTVDHGILLERLESDYGLKDSALCMLNSYLKSRTFSVNIDGIESEPKKLEFGVPQGSLLGPFMYILYTKPLENIAKNYGLNINMYADDCIIYMSFDNDNLNRAQENSNNCLIDIQNWMNSNYVKLNMEKTQLKIVNPKLPNPSFNLNYNNCLISTTTSVNILGVKIGKNLDINEFINKKLRICNFHIRNLLNIQDALPFKARILMVTNLILTNIDYCNAIMIGAKFNAIKPLQLIINKSVRYIFKLRKRTHITPYLKKLHILPIIYRIKYKTCIIAYRIYHKTTARYLQERFTTFIPTTTTNLRPGRGRDQLMFKMDKRINEKTTVIDLIKKRME